MSEHWILLCPRCRAVMGQCRCPDKNKSVRIAGLACAFCLAAKDELLCTRHRVPIALDAACELCLLEQPYHDPVAFAGLEKLTTLELVDLNRLLRKAR